MGRSDYGVLGFACTLSMVTYLDRACFGAAAPSIAAELGLADAAQLQWAVTAFAVAYAAFEVPAGALGDRLGPRRVLIRIVAWWSLCTALTAVVGLRAGGAVAVGLGGLVALRFLFGAGEAGAYPNITRLVHDGVPARRWETAQGLVFMTGRLMGGLTPLAWAVLVGGTATSAPLIGWRTAFVLFGLLGLAWVVAFAAWSRDRLGKPRADDWAGHGAVPWRALLASRSLWALCLMYFLVNHAWAFNLAYLPAYIQERFAIGPGDREGAIAKGAPLWVGAAGCLLGGPCVGGLTRLLADRRRARRALAISSLAAGGCWWAALHAVSLAGFCTLIAPAAFGIDLTLGSAWATCQDLGRRHATVTAASMNTIGTPGTALAGWATGSLVERSPAGRAAGLGLAPAALSGADWHLVVVSGYAAAFGTYVAAVFLAALCWAAIDPSGPIEADDAADWPMQ